MHSNEKEKSGVSCRGFAKDHLTVNHIKEEMGKQFTTRHLEQSLASNLQTHEQVIGGNVQTLQTREQAGGSNTQTQQGGGENRQKKD